MSKRLNWKTLRVLVLLLLCAGFAFGGTFTCKTTESKDPLKQPD